jgi:PKD repeat protein
VGSGCDANVTVMEVYHDTLFACGLFTQAGGSPASRIAKWYSPPAPVSAFSVLDPILCPSNCTTFDDASSGEVDTWAWTFPSGDPATSADSMPSVCYSTPGLYSATLTVTNAGGSSTFTLPDAVNVDICSGLAQEASGQVGLMVFPNPATDRMHITRGDGRDVGVIRVLDLLGRERLRIDPIGADVVIDLSAWPDGIYLLKTEGGGAVRLVKGQ